MTDHKKKSPRATRAHKAINIEEQQLNNAIIPYSHIERTLKPRTPAERERLLAWWSAAKRTEADVIQLAQKSFWRTDCTHLGGHLFCEDCMQIIAPGWCQECGQPLPRNLPTYIELWPTQASTNVATKIVEKLLRSFVAPEIALEILLMINERVFTPPLTEARIIELFADVGELEAERRESRGA